MSLNFWQIPPLTTELAALEHLKNRCHHVISVDIDPIFFKLAGNKNMHNIMNEFEFRPDRTTDYGVSCPWASKEYPYRPYNGENGVSTFSVLFLTGSFWYFHVTRTSIKAWMSLNFLKWDLTLAHWTQVSDRCPLGYLFISDFSEYYRWSQRTKIKYKLHYGWCTGRRFTAATRHNTSCSGQIKNQKLDPLRAMKTFIRRKVGHTT